MVNAYRCIIKGERSKYYIGKDYNGKSYIIEKNKNLRCRVGDDFYFFQLYNSFHYNLYQYNI